MEERVGQQHVASAAMCIGEGQRCRPLTQGRKVGDGLGHLVAVQAHHHAASRLAIDADVEEDLLGDLGLGQGAAVDITRRSWCGRCDYRCGVCL